MDTIKQDTLDRLDGAWMLIREAQEEIKRTGALVPGHMQFPLDQAERAVRVLTRIFEGWEPGDFEKESTARAGEARI